MKLLINKLKLQRELDRQTLYLVASYILVVFGHLYEGFTLKTLLGKVLFLFILTGVYALFYRFLKRLYYTFWTLLMLMCLWLTYMILSVPIPSFSFLFYSLALFLLVLEGKELWTPIYYPIVSWWEYDFRYRHDVKVKVLTGGQSLEGRLTDLRKGAGCIALFREVNVGEYIQVELDDGNNFKAEIMSKRYYSLGRPFRYGVRFELESREEKKSFKTFSKTWQNNRRLKRQEKFRPVKE